MVDLKKDLDEYLLLQNDQKKTFKLSMPTLKKPDIKGWFQNREPQEDETWFQETTKTCFPSLSRWHRILLFGVWFGLGSLCFMLSLLYIPVVVLKARKFSALFTSGSLCIMLSFFCLWGPWNYLKTIFSKERLLITLIYLTTLFGTLYCALHLQSTLLTVLCFIGQTISLVLTILATIPGGSIGFSLFPKLFSHSITTSNTLPI